MNSTLITGAWRKLQTVFGAHLVDIFHAVKRVSDKIPNRHPLQCGCLRDWQMVFQDPSDLGEKLLENNLDKFLQWWKDAECDGKKVLNGAVHMRKGCLSGIQPGEGQTGMKTCTRI